MSEAQKTGTARMQFEVGKKYQYMGKGVAYKCIWVSPSGRPVFCNGDDEFIPNVAGDYKPIKTKIVVQRFARVWSSGYVEISSTRFPELIDQAVASRIVADNVPVKIEYEV